VANLGKATSRGFDLEGQFILLEGLTLEAAAGYTHSTLDGNIYGGLDVGTGQRELIARDGDSTLLSPEWTSNFALNYERAIASGYRGYWRADVQHSGGFNRTESAGTTSYVADLYRGPAYNTLSLRTGVTHQGWNFALFVNNLTNTRPVLFKSYEFDSASKAIASESTLRPRTFGIDADYRF